MFSGNIFIVLIWSDVLINTEMSFKKYFQSNGGKLTESTELDLIIFCPGTSGLLLNEMFLSVFRGCVLEVSVAAEGELMVIFRMSRFDFLVSIRLLPAADESAHYCQSSHDDKNHNSNHP